MIPVGVGWLQHHQLRCGASHIHIIYYIIIIYHYMYPLKNLRHVWLLLLMISFSLLSKKIRKIYWTEIVYNKIVHRLLEILPILQYYFNTEYYIIIFLECIGFGKVIRCDLIDKAIISSPCLENYCYLSLLEIIWFDLIDMAILSSPCLENYFYLSLLEIIWFDLIKIAICTTIVGWVWFFELMFWLC